MACLCVELSTPAKQSLFTTCRRSLGRTKEQHEHLVALEEEEVLGFVGHGATKTPPGLGGVGKRKGAEREDSEYEEHATTKVAGRF